MAEFLAMCTSPGAPATPASAPRVGAPRGARQPDGNAAARHTAGHPFYQAANGVWLIHHEPRGYLSGWPG